MLVSILGMITALQAVRQFAGVTTSQVNVRVSPNSKSTKIGTLEKGKKVVVIATVSKGKSVGGVKADFDFYKLNTGGYVVASYVKITGAISTPEPTLTPPPAAEIDVEEDDDIIVVGDESGDDSVVVVPDDTTLVDDSGDIEIDDEDTSLGDETNVADGEFAAKKMQVKSTVNLREGPGIDFAIIKKLSGGAYITIIQYLPNGYDFEGETISGNWYRLNTGGYVSADFLQNVSSMESKTTTTGSKAGTTKVGTATADTLMYSSPSVIGTKKGILKKGGSRTITGTYKDGSTYKAMKVTGTWYKLDNGFFVKSATISVSTKTTSVSTSQTITSTLLSFADGVSAKTNVKVRKLPSTTSTELRLMTGGETGVIEKIVKSGTTVGGVKVVGDWAKLVGLDGYIRVDYLQFDSQATVTYSLENF